MKITFPSFTMKNVTFTDGSVYLKREDILTWILETAKINEEYGVIFVEQARLLTSAQPIPK